MIRNVKIELLSLGSRMSAQLSSTVQFPNTADHRPYTLTKPTILDYTVRVIKAFTLSGSWFLSCKPNREVLSWQVAKCCFLTGGEGGEEVRLGFFFFCYIEYSQKKWKLLFSTYFFTISNMLSDIAYRYEKWPSLFLLPRHPFGKLQPVMQEINKAATYLLPYV